MITIITFLFFILGLIIGSFLNVVIYRYQTSKNLGGRSACMSCRSSLTWYELIPVFSFIFLGGRCKSCRTHISLQYPLVEITTGILFFSLFLKFQDVFFGSPYEFAGIFVYYVTAFALLLIIATYDLRHKIIPDQLSFGFGILTFVGLFLFNNFSLPTQAGFFIHMPTTLEFLSGPILALPFASLWLISRGAWMGLGDAKLAIGLGWLSGLAVAISGVVVAFWAGAIVGIALLFKKSHFGMKSEIPFAPFLVFGAYLAFILELHLFPL